MDGKPVSFHKAATKNGFFSFCPIFWRPPSARVTLFACSGKMAEFQLAGRTRALGGSFWANFVQGLSEVLGFVRIGLYYFQCFDKSDSFDSG